MRDIFEHALRLSVSNSQKLFYWGEVCKYDVTSSYNIRKAPIVRSRATYSRNMNECLEINPSTFLPLLQDNSIYP